MTAYHSLSQHQCWQEGGDTQQAEGREGDGGGVTQLARAEEHLRVAVSLRVRQQLARSDAAFVDLWQI